jgi:hypothetical protein
MAKATRIYNAKDVDMLVSLKTIVLNAIDHQAELQAKRASWTSDYFDNLMGKIDFAFKTHLGIEPSKDLRQTTQSLKALHKQILKDLSFVKVQMMADMKDLKELRDHLLQVLGFTAYLKQARNGDQEGLINLLQQFNLNLTVTVKGQITSSTGIPAALLDSIANRAEIMTNSNADQENFKGKSRVLTAGAIVALNNLYEEVIGVAKIATNIFVDNPTLKSLFSFTQISKALNAKVKVKKP